MEDTDKLRESGQSEKFARLLMARNGGAGGNVKRIEKGKEEFIFVGWPISNIKYSIF